MEDNSKPNGQEPDPDGRGDAPKRDYEVGYCKPPKETQFPKGNPGGGRKKGSLSLKTDLLAELSERRIITEDGKKRKLTQQRILLKAQMKKGMKGDTRAGDMILSMVLRLIGPDGEAAHVEALPVADLEILEAYVQRIIAEKTKS